MRRTAAISALLGVAALLAWSGTGAATRTIEIPSKVSIESSGTQFSGRVTTGRRGCFSDRTVVLYDVVAGPDRIIGKSRTDEHGEWAATVSGWAGFSLNHFYAEVRRSHEGTAGTIYVCLPAKSTTIKPGR